MTKKREHRDVHENHYVIKNNKKLTCGYTTGSCAAAAAKAAAMMLFSGQEIEHVELLTPAGIRLFLAVEQVKRTPESVSCAVKKDSGDDPDITNGISIYAAVGYQQQPGIEIRAGEGIGTITKRGFEQPVGAPAINKVPREMIREAVAAVYKVNLENAEQGLYVEISAPEGVQLAQKTFNPKLGIKGGISILGTSGIVEPMSEKAVIDSILLEMKVKKENGEDVILAAPGNYGGDFAKETLGLHMDKAVKCSNFIGEVIDEAVNLKLQGLLFVAHIGKFAKISGGIMNTHSRNSDARLELLAAHAARGGASLEVIQDVLACATTEEAIEILVREQNKEATMREMMARIQYYLNQRSYGKLPVGAIVFSNLYGELGQTKNTSQIIDKMKRGSR